MAPKFVVLAVMFLLAGCGLRPPELKEAYDPDLPAENGHVGLSGSSVLEFEIQKKVYCELKEAVTAALAVGTTQGPDLQHQSPSKIGLLDPAWLAEVSLTLQVDESTALNPGVAPAQPLPNGLVGFGGSAAASGFQQSFNLGLGGTLSQTGTTIDRFDPFWTIEFLARKPHPDSICAIPENPANDPILKTYMRETGASMTSSPLLIDGRLGLKEWLVGAFIGRYYLYSVR